MLDSESTKLSVSSGMIRLSCPHLVKAIDELESEGGITRLNSYLTNQAILDEVVEEEGVEVEVEEREERKTDNINSEEYKMNANLRESFLGVNKAWKQIRLATMSDDDRAVAIDYLGEEGATQMINSGIIGVTSDKIDDVKCLHAVSLPSFTLPQLRSFSFFFFSFSSLALSSFALSSFFFFSSISFLLFHFFPFFLFFLS